jgi:hypothetical protein
MEKRRVATDKLQLATSLCHATIHAIIHKDLKMKKVCTLWVSKDLNPKQRREMVQNCQELLALHNKDPEGFPARLVTGNRS